MALVSIALLACRTPERNPPRPVPTDHTALVEPGHSGTTSTDSAGDSASSAAHTGLPPDCLALPAGPRPFTSTTVLSTEEDFDFDATGLLLAQNYNSIAGIDRYGTRTVVATGLTGDAAGIRVAPSGDFVYASPDDGRLVGVSRSTGGSRTLASGLRFPNSVEMSVDGVAYVAEFAPNGRIVSVDLYTLAAEELGRMDYVNGMTLSMDEQVLYLASSSAYWAGPTTIHAVDRQPGGGFGGGARVVVQSPALVTSLAVDACDNLYLLSYLDGRVFRYSESTAVLEQLADLGGGGYAGFSSIRFSPGLGGFSTTSLYATNRLRVFEIDLGVEGRHVLHTP
jgi:hypothetical protein